MAGVTTIILVGCTGSGKSATGNSILRRRAFRSKSGFQRVTTKCQLHTTKVQDGQILRVIDTPGLFDSSMSPKYIEENIVRCIDMAKDGIHAILMVVSLRSRFSKEQADVVDTLKHLFGTRILDYMIVTFTGGDELEENETLDHRIAYACPEALKDLLEKCGNRRVVFDNMTKDKGKKTDQLHQLLTLINETVVKNGGKPYTRELFAEFKKEDAKKDSRYSKEAYNEEQIRQAIAEMVHKKLQERNEEIVTTLKEDYGKLEKRNEEMIIKLKEELVRVRRKSNEHANADKNAIENPENEILKLRKELEKLKEDHAKLEKRNEEMIIKLKEEVVRAHREGNEHANVDKNAIENTENEMSKLRKELDKLKEDHAKLEKRNEEMIIKLKEDLVRAHKEGNGRANVDKNAIENTENEIRKLREELDKLKEDHAQLDKRNEEMIIKLKEELVRARRESNERANTDKNAIENTENEIHKLREEMNKLKEDHVKLEKRNEDMIIKLKDKLVGARREGNERANTNKNAIVNTENDIHKLIEESDNVQKQKTESKGSCPVL